MGEDPHLDILTTIITIIIIIIIDTNKIKYITPTKKHIHYQTVDQVIKY
jgi:hypothetical protein